jgi:hypothetical protein
MAGVISLSRVLISAAALAFGLFHAAIGFAVLERYDRVDLPAIALLLYLGAVLLAVFVGSEVRLAAPIAWLVTALILGVPTLVNLSLTSYLPNSYTTWYVSGIGTLMGVLAVRQAQLPAIVGSGALVTQLFIFGGLNSVFTSGLIGALLMVLTGLASAFIISSAVSEAERYQSRASETLAATAARSAIRTERKARLRQNLRGALPLLERIVNSEGKLSESEKLEARLLEAELRDGIRGRSLTQPELVQVVRALRRQGVEVQLVDDGGLEDLSADEAEALIGEVVGLLTAVKQGKVVVRAVRGESWRITVAALRKESAVPDLFVRL